MVDSTKIFAYQQLELKLGYGFSDLSLLERALTHKSFSHNNNERLEYVGDSILGMVIAKALYEKFPNNPEGDLTKMRSSLVRESTLAEIAREFGIGNCLRLGHGELKSGGANRDSLLADSVESIIAAIFIDTKENFSAVRSIILSWYKDRIEKIDPKANQRDPKSTLQELLQKNKCDLPTYYVDKIEGKDNDLTFYVSVECKLSKEKFHGVGKSRRKAEQEAAQKMLDALLSN